MKQTTAKSPIKIKEELSNAVQNIRSVQKFLKGKANESVAGIGSECLKAASSLENILETNQLPESYKVAVVGRFKAGKSSFVNELLESKLAGEDTSPETAAVTSFTHGSKVEATINFIDKKIWEEQKNLYAEDPKNIDAHRAKMWESFKKPKKNNEGIEESFDLDHIESSLLTTDKSKLVISLDQAGGKAAEKAFREKLKLYTSGSKPQHCLVSSINISTPSSLLHGGIELVDTPGLDDTERFRVSLTEQSVEHVDAILFLTKSGVAYGQSEKDFLMSLLRKGTIKQLIIVITQVDQTYEQHVKAAQADDDEPQSISDRIAMERRRIKEEIRKTLEELSGSDSSATKSYAEQFANVDIVFTSVMAHRDHQAKRSPSVVIASDDPGGLINFKKRLNGVLSTESRTSAIANLILGQSKDTLENLADVIANKVGAIKNTKNRDEVERRLNNFRTQFAEICKGTEKEMTEIFLTFKESTDLRLVQHKTTIENIVLKAGKELNKFKTQDVGRHWKSRRSGYWGYMFDLQSRVANRIFPIVQEMLESHVADFSTYVRRHERKISKLTKEAVTTASQLELGEFTNFDIKKRLKETTNNILRTTEDQIIAEQEQIIKLLDTFVTDEVENKMAEAKKSVTDIWGRGTTSAQQSEVIEFYDEIENILSEALTEHIAKRNFDFAKNLLNAAQHAPRDTFVEVDAQLDSALENLRLAAEMALSGQQESAEKVLSEISKKSMLTVSGFTELLDSLNEKPEVEAEEELLVPIAHEKENSNSPVNHISSDWTDDLLHSCKSLFNSHILKEGQSGWPFSKIFDPVIFKDAEKIRIVEPYLFKSHQLRNLQELLLLIIDSSKPKRIEVFTLPPSLELQEHLSRQFDNLSKELFNSNGVLLEIQTFTSLHDRYVFSSSGFVAKLGRGLDIYKPSIGLAAHRQESRKVRACEITIFQK